VLAFAVGMSGSRVDGWRLAVVQVAAFLIVNFYFVLFELRSQGRTPGKRMLGLQVIDADGGRLSASSVLARNLVRDVEVFVPLSVLAAPEQLAASHSGVVRLLAIAWVLALLFWPLFNRDRRRIGDLVGGTLVVLAPRTDLAPDVAGTASIARRGSPAGPGSAAPGPFRFTDAQLDVYGEYELKVLENVLRSSEALDHRQTLESVYDKVRRKIGHDGPATPHDAERFLRDFYAAQRARLERGRLFGKIRRDKHSRE
jgi:uncharacterized RDD family membrane protein YckC